MDHLKNNFIQLLKSRSDVASEDILFTQEKYWKHAAASEFRLSITLFLLRIQYFNSYPEASF